MARGSFPGSSGGSRWVSPSRPGGMALTGRVGTPGTAMATGGVTVMDMGMVGTEGTTITHTIMVTITDTIMDTTIIPVLPDTRVRMVRNRITISTGPLTLPDRRPRGRAGRCA